MGPSPELFWVDLDTAGLRVQVGAGQSLLDAARSGGVELVALCGGAGTCGTCRVRVIEGPCSPPTLEELATLSAEESAAGTRLACETKPCGHVRVSIPPESLSGGQRLQLEGQEIPISPDPVVVAVETTLPATATEREGRGTRIASRDGETVATLPPATPLLGLAVDLGTTKLAAYLVDLETGATLAKAGEMNPQAAYGEDVVSRIEYTNREADGRRVLQASVMEALNGLLRVLRKQAGAGAEQIVEAVIVGNTAMHHLCAGLPVWQLGVAPYVPAVSGAFDVPARDLHLDIAAGAYVHFPATIGGYVGADHLAALLATDLWKPRPTTLLLDIGTNTEISLAHAGRLWSCSCASGPAFEGARICDGMRAGPGAIERVQIVEGEARLRTIGGIPPIGVCGSGILDALAAMLKAGIIDRTGRIRPSMPGVRLRDGQPEFVLVPASQTGHGRDIVIRRGDVNQIQLAKGAIRAGLEILLAQAGLDSSAVQECIVAGAFGTYLDVGSAVEIGLLPKLPRDRFHPVGNAAGMGAKQILISRQRRRVAAEIAARVLHVDLASEHDFTERFVEAMYFGPVEAN